VVRLCGGQPFAARIRVFSPRQLPTDHDHAVPTREYQSDQPSQPLARTLSARLPQKKQRAQSALVSLDRSFHISRMT
jgi:hypothetical protein